MRESRPFTISHELTRMTDKIVYKHLSYKIVGFSMHIHRKLGHGFLEKVYENTLMVLLRKEGIYAEQQAPTLVYFEGQEVGNYVADIVVERQIILELKSIDTMTPAHRAQAINYLKATKLRLALLINFGKKRLEYERYVL